MDYCEEMKQAIKDAIISKYGKLDDMGCYSGNAWLSTEEIYTLICETLDDNDYMFLED